MTYTNEAVGLTQLNPMQPIPALSISPTIPGYEFAVG
jgi:hypothetical protein